MDKEDLERTGMLSKIIEDDEVSMEERLIEILDRIEYNDFPIWKKNQINNLINDIGNELKTYATMTSLTRTKQGKVSIEETNTLNEIKNNNYKLYKIDEVLDIESINVSDELAQKIRTGQKINNEFNVHDKVIFKDKNNFILGIYESKDGLLTVWKNFV